MGRLERAADGGSLAAAGHRRGDTSGAGEVADGLRLGGCNAEFVNLESPQGHDAFLVDIDHFGPVIAGFLARL